MQLALWQLEPPGFLGSRSPGKRRSGRAVRNGSAGPLGPSLAQIDAEADPLASTAYAPDTRRAYQSDWDAFVRWCASHELPSLPSTVDVLCEYLAYLGLLKHKVSTIRRKRLAIGLAHAHAGFPRLDRGVRVRTVELGLAKKYGSREVGADPLIAYNILRIVETLDDSARGDRDRAIFTLAFAGAFRASELVALDREHLTFTARGLTVLVAFSKEDQLGRGKKTHIPLGARPETGAVRALQTWLARVGEGEGPVFRVMHGQVIDKERISTRAVSRVWTTGQPPGPGTSWAAGSPPGRDAATMPARGHRCPAGRKADRSRPRRVRRR